MHGFFGWIAETASWLLAFAKDHPESAFIVAFLVSFGESFAGLSFLVPGTTILIALGALLGVNGAAPWDYGTVWLAAAVGAILGDWISYWIGHRFKEHVLSTWPISRYRAQMDVALRFFGRWGVWAIFLGRFLGPFRATVPLVAGISQMKFWPFQIANVTSALIWSASLVALGAVGWAALVAVWHGLGGWPTIAVATAAVLTIVLFRERIGLLWRSWMPK